MQTTKDKDKELLNVDMFQNGNTNEGEKRGCRDKSSLLESRTNAGFPGLDEAVEKRGR